MKLTELIAQLQELHALTGTEEVYIRGVDRIYTDISFVQLDCQYDEDKDPMAYWVTIEGEE